MSKKIGKKKVAIVTGGNKGLGLAICRVLGREDLLLFLEGDLILFRETLEGFGVLLAFSFDLMVSCWDTNNRDDLRTLPLLLLELGVFWFI